MNAAYRDRTVDIRRVRAGDLLPDERNWRKHPAHQRKALRAVLDRIGIADVVIAREADDGLRLIDGHLRADLNPDQEMPVLVVDLDEEEAGIMLATLDPLAGMAQADNEALEALVAHVDSDDAMLRNLLEKADVLPALPAEGLTDADAVTEPPAEPVSKRGDVWALGDHRLMCGDSTDAGDVERLLGGARPRLMVTDPPYGVNYDAAWRDRAFADGQLNYDAASPGRVSGDAMRSYGNASGSTRRTGGVTHDDSVDWSGALREYQPDVLYVWSPPGDHSLHFGAIIQRAGYAIRNQIIWNKTRAVISRGHYSYQHEPCWYAIRKGRTAKWLGRHLESSVWSVHWDKNVEGGHSTQKPVECMERPIRNHEGDAYDPFVGSGTTIIAAERQGRKAYAMEIEPRYVDASVTRWENYTGRKAQRASE